MNLGKHMTGNYLPEGDHVVMVQGFKAAVNPARGTKGVTYTVVDDRGRKSDITYWLTEKAMYRLGNFALDCGKKPEECENVEYGFLVGSRVAVTVRKEPSGKGDNREYCNIVDTYPAESYGKSITRPPKPTTIESASPPNDDLPEAMGPCAKDALDAEIPF